MPPTPRHSSCGAVLTAAFASGALAGPQTTAWPVNGPDDTAGVAAAALSGWYAAADSYEDDVEVRWPDGSLRADITRARIQALLPWMSLDGSEEGVGALAFSDSGRLLFIAVHDSNPAGDGRPSDAILRYDTDTDALVVFDRVEISAGVGSWPHESLAHFRGRLYYAGPGEVRVYRAGANDMTATLLSVAPYGAGGQMTGLAVDRATGTIYHSVGRTLMRSPAGDAINPVVVGTLPANAAALAWTDHYGGPGQGGLYVLDSTASPAVYRVWFVTSAQARGQQALAPTLYLAGAAAAHDLAATADGRLLIGMDEDALLVRDTNEARLDFGAWASDEFAQEVAFARSLVTTGPGGGGPAGWVVDGDVAAGGTRFHPASPDAAAWAVLLLMMSERVTGDPTAQATVAAVLRRYAGRAGDGVAPLRSADGIFWHWIDPATGGPKAGWGDGYATMSTMLIVAAADRARRFYAGNPDIRASAEAIVCGVSNWDRYFDQSGRMYLRGLAGGGPESATISSGFHEGILFADQAGAYGGALGDGVAGLWMHRDFWPTASLIAGRPVTGQTGGQFLPAFVTLYPWLVMDQFRGDAGWRANMANLRASHAAWTDDAGPRLNTVFSAGTTAQQWGGYNPDSLSDHPGDVTTLTSLLGLVSGDGTGARLPEAYGAYQAYRMGARQAFLGGASMLYRRSNVSPSYTPDSAGLPDVAVGALGLAELLAPGSVREVLTGVYASCAACPADFNGDGFLDFFDYDDFVACYEAPGACPPGRDADVNGDGFVDFFDYDAYISAFEEGC